MNPPRSFCLTALLLTLGSGACCASGTADAPDRAAETPPARRVVADFADSQEADAWRVVNDDVMGGRSEGDTHFDDGHMTFFGSINTNGGGFSSVRRAIEPGQLTGADRVRLRVKTDGRPYRVTFRDGSHSRRGEVMYRAPIEAAASDGWQTVSVAFADLEASFHGNPVDAEPFDPAAAYELGLILNDTRDGPFHLAVQWIAAVQ